MGIGLIGLQEDWRLVWLQSAYRLGLSQPVLLSVLPGYVLPQTAPGGLLHATVGTGTDYFQVMNLIQLSNRVKSLEEN